MMCGRFTLAVDAATQIQHRSRQQVTVITGRARRGDLFWAYWGLLPAWAKDRSLGFKLINARSETAESRPSFRDAYRQRRCLIPADGFFEWKSVDDGKQPIHITLPRAQAFCLRRSLGALALPGGAGCALLLPVDICCRSFYAGDP